jgi:hypothetical protein
MRIYSKENNQQDNLIDQVVDKLNQLITSVNGNTSEFFTKYDKSIRFGSCANSDYTKLICFTSLALIKIGKDLNKNAYTAFNQYRRQGESYYSEFAGLTNEVCERLLIQLNKYSRLNMMEIELD